MFGVPRFSAYRGKRGANDVTELLREWACRRVINRSPINPCRSECRVVCRRCIYHMKTKSRKARWCPVCGTPMKKNGRTPRPAVNGGKASPAAWEPPSGATISGEWRKTGRVPRLAAGLGIPGDMDTVVFVKLKRSI